MNRIGFLARPFASTSQAAILALAVAALPASGQTGSHAENRSSSQSSTQSGDPVPEIRQFMLQVVDHQKQLEKVRENYTYRASNVDQEIDSSGKVTKTESQESEVFFINTHRIERTLAKDGKPLAGHDLEKEKERVDKLVEKAQNTPPGTPLEGRDQTVSITHLLDIMEVTNPRREIFRGRPTIVFDFAGRRDAKTHGLAEDASKKIAGTIWVDEKDKQVARMEAHFTDNFHVAGGLLANVQKGSSFFFDQAPVNGEIWFPTQAEGHVEARLLLVKGIRQHFTEHDSNYERFSVETETSKTATVTQPTKN